jgi:hypothetical protein
VKIKFFFFLIELNDKSWLTILEQCILLHTYLGELGKSHDNDAEEG